MPKLHLPLTLAMAGLLLACNRKAEPEAEASPPIEQTASTAAPAEATAHEVFAPPTDGLLTEEQVRRFLLAHEALAKVNAHYLDRLATATPDQVKSIQAALELAGEKSARKFGLRGQAEYRWILEEAPRHTENVALLEKMKVGVVAP